tara:strand:+ start:296 stop:556 length:261 start_codon:yes stop_codon:yes gene_type:complete
VADDVLNALVNKRDARVDVLRDVLGLKRANVEAVDIAANVVQIDVLRVEPEDVPRADPEDVPRADPEDVPRVEQEDVLKIDHAEDK